MSQDDYRRTAGLSLFRIGKLLEIELDDPGIVIAVLGLHILNDFRPQLTRQFAPALAGVLLGVFAKHAGIDHAALRLATLVVGPLVGAFITWLITSRASKRSEKAKLERELRRLTFSISSANVTNHLAPLLRQLKQFFLEHNELLEKHKVNFDFFRKWLQNPFLEVDNAVFPWTKESLDELQREVRNLTI